MLQSAMLPNPPSEVWQKGSIYSGFGHVQTLSPKEKDEGMQDTLDKVKA